MDLKSLLQYSDIVIQCHDDPDADTVASGFALLRYLQANGKCPRLVYSGRRKIGKSSLCLMKEKLDIPLDYLPQPFTSPAELLVTVDCRAGQNNVTPLPYRHLAVIDHHELDAAEVLPPLHALRTDCGACVTIVWALLQEAGFAVEDRRLATALYYGLYMDTQKFKGAEKLDREMLDTLRFDWDIILQLHGADLGLQDFQAAGSAFANLRYQPRHHFAVALVDTAEPYMLGVVSDMMMDVHELEVCAAYCLLEKENCVKVSVRCCKRKDRANEIVHWLVREMGNDGGGDRTKAAGRLPLPLLAERDPAADPLALAGELIFRSLTAYFARPLQRLDPRLTGCGPDAFEAFCGQAPVRCHKKQVPVGYLRAADLFCEGTEILLRMLEGDTVITVTPDLILMIGVDGEVYCTTEDKLRKNYTLTEQQLALDPADPWTPKVYHAGKKEVKLLAPYAKQCVAKDTAQILAARLTCRLEVLVWDDWHLGEPGDWLVCRADDDRDAYIIQKAVFARTYEPVQ